MIKELFQKLGKVLVFRDILNNNYKGLLSVEMQDDVRNTGIPSGPLVSLVLSILTAKIVPNTILI